MSTYMAMAYESCIQLLTDGAMYGPDHVLLDARTSKAWSSSKIPLVVTGRGHRQIVEWAATTLIGVGDRVGSIDKTLELAQEAIDCLKSKSGVVFDLLIAGWSETSGPVLYSCISHAEGILDVEGMVPFRLHKMQGEAWAVGDLGFDDVGHLVAKMSMRNPAFFEVHGADFMEALRKRPSTLDLHGHGAGFYSIGGHCQLTTITAAGVSTRTLREWEEDRAGERINPFSTDGSVVPLVNGRKPNRAERRAAKARRAA